QAGARRLRDFAPDRLRAGEADPGDARIVEQRVADLRALAHHQVEDPSGKAGLADDLGERPGAAGHQLRGLEYHRVAVAQRRRDLPGRDGDREIPRRDDRDDAERLARDLDADAGAHRLHDLAGDAQRLAGEELEDVGRAHHFARRLRQRLALLARQQIAELRLAVENLGA